MGLDTVDVSRMNELTGAFPKDRANRVARNLVTTLNVSSASVDRARARSYHDTFGVRLKTSSAITAQRQSGRCWIFATLNVARSKTLSILDVDEIELSQNYLQFYDKLERANSRLEYLIDTVDEDWTGRQVTELLLGGFGDGGQFMFCANILKKWGIVPKAEMPDTACSKDTAQMNNTLMRLLRKDATELRGLAARGAGTDELRVRKQEMLADFHQILCCCLGEPPTRFDFCCQVGEGAQVDPDKVGPVLSANGSAPARMLRDPGITPQEFAQRYVQLDPADYVELVNFPGKTRPYGHAFGLNCFDPVIGGQPLRFLNMPMEYLEDAAVESLKAGVPVFMMCDVNQNGARKDPEFSGVLALDGCDVDGLFGVDLQMDKADMIDNRECGMTHCMVFQGVELDRAGVPVAWRVENSWGDDFGMGGYLVMTAEWFRLYGGDVVVERRFVPQEVLQLWDEAPLERRNYWDCLLSIK